MKRENKKRQEQHPYIGTTVGQYRIDQLLGGGAMGLVFRAHQKSIDRDVAVKFLSYNHKCDELSQKRLEREAQAMGKLNHPGLVCTHEFGTTDYGQPYIVMEYLKGEPLSELLAREKRIEIKKTVGFAKQIAKAMDYAHRHGVIHRDLKPANIMVTIEPGEEHLKIFDFGIARLTQDSQLLTRPGMVMGSPVYMSPEQCRSRDTDARSDIYTLGVIMYFSITGLYPIIGDGGQMTMIHKISKKPLPMSEIAPELNIHPSLELLVMRMLAIDPILRPQTMSHVYNELEKITKANAYTFENNVLKHLSNDCNSEDIKPSYNKIDIAELFETKTDTLEQDLTVSYLVSAMLLVIIGLFVFNSFAPKQKMLMTKKSNSKVLVQRLETSTYSPVKKKVEMNIQQPATFDQKATTTGESIPQSITKPIAKPKETYSKMASILTSDDSKSSELKSGHPRVASENAVNRPPSPLQKLNSLDAKTRMQIKNEVIDYFKSKNHQNYIAKKRLEKRKFQRTSSLNNQRSYGRTPYNKIHSRFISNKNLRI